MAQRRIVSKDIPSDFVCSVPSHHMADSFVPAGVVGEPCVDFQHLVVYNDNWLAMAVV
jgi:hypothetical protein